MISESDAMNDDLISRNSSAFTMPELVGFRCHAAKLSSMVSKGNPYNPLPSILSPQAGRGGAMSRQHAWSTQQSGARTRAHSESVREMMRRRFHEFRTKCLGS